MRSAFSIDIINLTWRSIPVSLAPFHHMEPSEELVEIASTWLKGINLWAYRILRITIGGVFVYAGAIKVMDVKGFARMVSQYGLVPDPFLAPVAWGLPVLELLAGLGLVFEFPW